MAWRPGTRIPRTVCAWGSRAVVSPMGGPMNKILLAALGSGAAFLVVGVGLSIKCVPPAPTPQGTGFTIANPSSGSITVSVAFGSDSVVGPSAWSGCPDSGLICQFTIPAQTNQAMPIAGQYLNATFTMQPIGDGGVGCGTTKVELNINNPNWYDIVDLSLVDGYSTALG